MLERTINEPSIEPVKGSIEETQKDSKNELMKQRILEYIATYTDENGFTPSYRDIGEAVGLKSTSSVHWYIVRLKDEGRLITVSRKPETFALPNNLKLNGAMGSLKRVRLELADGGIVSFDCCITRNNNGISSFSFSGVLDASQIKGLIGQIINVRLIDGDKN